MPASHREKPDSVPFTIVTYSHGLLHLRIPYHASRGAAGQLTMEVLDPEDKVLGQAARHVDVAEEPGRWQGEIKLAKPLPLDDLVWHRLRYRSEYAGGRLEKFSLTATQAILHFDVFAAGDTVTVKFRLRAKYPSGRGHSSRRSTSTTIRRSAQWRGPCNWK